MFFCKFTTGYLREAMYLTGLTGLPLINLSAAERLEPLSNPSYQDSSHKVQTRAGEETSLKLPVALVLEFGNEIRRAYIQAHTRGESETVMAERCDHTGHQAADDCRETKGCAGQKRAPPR